VYRVVRGCAERAEIEIGQRDPRFVEVVRGLRVGERVAIEGLQSLSGGEAVILKGRRPPGGEGKEGRQGKGEEKGSGEQQPRCPAQQQQQQQRGA
jgi:hypothetical protein